MIWYIKKDGNAIQIECELVTHGEEKMIDNKIQITYQVQQIYPNGGISVVEKGFETEEEAKKFIGRLLSHALTVTPKHCTQVMDYGDVFVL